jgi:hypothetical protein
MTKIYDQHRAAFNNVAAYVITYGSARVATVAIKFPRDGAGRLYSYVHWHGVEMARGYAGGGGYDKRTAACADAARKLPEHLPAGYDGAGDVYGRFVDALGRDGGNDWTAALRKAGFDVLQAV